MTLILLVSSIAFGGNSLTMHPVFENKDQTLAFDIAARQDVLPTGTMTCGDAEAGLSSNIEKVILADGSSMLCSSRMGTLCTVVAPIKVESYGFPELVMHYDLVMLTNLVGGMSVTESLEIQRWVLGTCFMRIVTSDTPIIPRDRFTWAFHSNN